MHDYTSCPIPKLCIVIKLNSCDQNFNHHFQVFRESLALYVIIYVLNISIPLFKRKKNQPEQIFILITGPNQETTSYEVCSICEIAFHNSKTIYYTE